MVSSKTKYNWRITWVVNWGLVRVRSEALRQLPPPPSLMIVTYTMTKQKSVCPVDGKHEKYMQQLFNNQFDLMYFFNVSHFLYICPLRFISSKHILRLHAGKT